MQAPTSRFSFRGALRDKLQRKLRSVTGPLELVGFFFFRTSIFFLNFGGYECMLYTVDKTDCHSSVRHLNNT